MYLLFRPQVAIYQGLFRTYPAGVVRYSCVYARIVVDLVEIRGQVQGILKKGSSG